MEKRNKKYGYGLAFLAAGAAFFLFTGSKSKGLQKPVTGKITSPFGNRTHPVTGKVQFHNGIDVSVPLKTPILAPSDSVVSSLPNNATGGNQLILKLPNGDYVGFAHLYAAKVKVGQKVKQGDIIAYSGNTGLSTGPHTHITVKSKGEFVDPAKYFGY